MSDSPVSASHEDSSQANLAVGLAAAAVVLYVIFAIIDLDNALWLLVAALGAAAAIVGGEPARDPGQQAGHSSPWPWESSPSSSSSGGWSSTPSPDLAEHSYRQAQPAGYSRRT